MKTSGPTRRTLGKHASGRAAEVVTRVLRETRHQLSVHGYSGLSVDAVAEAAGVHKTTIYRRWPTRAELVAAALIQRSAAEEAAAKPEGWRGLRAELVAFLAEFVRSGSNPEGRALIRIMQLDRPHPELDRIVGELRARRRERGLALIRRGIDRGELPEHAPAALAIEILLSTVTARLYSDQKAPRSFLERLVELVLAGAGTPPMTGSRRGGDRSGPGSRR